MTETKILESAHGVTLKSISLLNNGTVIACSYLVETLHTPERWSFDSRAEASARFIAEVTLSKADPLAIRRFNNQ